ncbi:MAG: DUF4406 domain-containing protein [Clostridia bacterium]|nr:DUF4406 domain-containing protein [Clostridia bacterium]
MCSALRGDMQENIRKAQMYCEYVVREHENLLPIAPHIYLTQFLDDANEKDREFGLKAGLFLLSECDELWYFGHQITSGMTDEICYAMKNGIPVRYVPEENYEKYTTERMNFNEIQF